MKVMRLNMWLAALLMLGGLAASRPASADAVISDVTGGGCVLYQNNGIGHWDVEQGKTYLVTISGVTDGCSNGGDAATIPILVHSSNTGNMSLTAAQVSQGVYRFYVQMPANACETYPIEYCPGDPGKPHFVGGDLRASTFGPNCTNPVEIVCGAPPQGCTVTCPEDKTVECGQPTDPSATGTAVSSDPTTCPVSFLDAETAGNCVNHVVKVIKRTWTAGIASCVQTITVVDTTNPTAPAAPEDKSYQCATEVPPAGPLTATDNCSDPIVITGVDTNNGGTGCKGSPLVITRTWTFTDACGNSSSVHQTITVVDETAPVAPAAPEDATYNCLSAVPGAGTLTATDNCSGDITVTGMDSNNGGKGCKDSPLIITRTWTFADACGNTSSVSQTITVIDDVAPTLDGVPNDTTADCSTVPGAANVTASDNCDTNPTVSMSEDSTQDPDVTKCGHYSYTIKRTWTATDACGNTVSASQTITVQDMTPPTITQPDPVTECLKTINGNTLTVTPSAVVSDNCDQNPTITGTRDDGKALSDAYPCGVTTITWTAKDACGNAAVAVTQKVTITGPKVSVTKFYDANANGLNDDGQFVAGIKVTLSGTDSANNPVSMNGTTDANGYVEFSCVPVGSYSVSETLPAGSGWTATKSSDSGNVIDCSGFAATLGNVCRGGGGLTIGYWSNSNGNWSLTNQGGGTAANLAFLVGLNLRNANGSAFDPASLTSFQSWLTSASATNMAYMLSAQLAATELNVKLNPVKNKAGVVQGGFLGTQMIYAPGTASANLLGYASINAVMAEANAYLATHGSVPSNDPTRALATALKDALDNANNSRNIVATSPCTVQY